ncbi:MAG: hypothetical protein V3V01_06860 [Acidimicrobiales bacterium]
MKLTRSRSLGPIVAACVVASACGGHYSSGVEQSDNVGPLQEKVEISVDTQNPREALPAAESASEGQVGEEQIGSEFFDHQQLRLASLSADNAFATLVEALPNVTFTDSVNGRYSGSEIAVVGTVVKVEPLVSYALTGQEPGEVAVPIGSSSAAWTGFEVTVRTQETLGLDGDLVAADEFVQFLVVTDPSIAPADVSAALTRSERVLLLGIRSGIIGDRPDLYSIAAQGSFWFEVDEKGGISAPTMPPEVAARMLPSGTNLDSIREASTVDLELLPSWERS